MQWANQQSSRSQWIFLPQMKSFTPVTGTLKIQQVHVGIRWSYSKSQRALCNYFSHVSFPVIWWAKAIESQ